MPSLDDSSEQSMKDWKDTLDSVVDLFNRSSLGQCYGKFFCTVDIMAKLVGMMTDYCAKEKKGDVALEELKQEAIIQNFGEDKMVQKSTKKLLSKFLDIQKEPVKSLGDQKQ